jgi:hypothetical protein
MAGRIAEWLTAFCLPADDRIPRAGDDLIGNQQHLRFCKLATDENACALWADRLIVRVPICDGENLTGSVHRSLIVLCDNESAGKNEAPDRKRMSVRPPGRPGLQVLGFYFGVTVGLEFGLKFDFVH